MTSQDKLEIFATSVLDNATGKKDKLTAHLNRKLEKTLSAKREEYEEEAMRRYKREVAKTELETRNIRQNLLHQQKINLIKKREELIDRIFENVLKKVTDFANSDKYQDYISGKIDEGLAVLGEGTEITLCEKDVKLKEKYNAKISDFDFIGGAILRNNSKNLYLDLTLKTKIQREREDFLEHYNFEVGSEKYE